MEKAIKRKRHQQQKHLRRLVQFKMIQYKIYSNTKRQKYQHKYIRIKQHIFSLPSLNVLLIIPDIAKYYKQT